MSILRSGYSGLSWASTPFVLGYLKWRAFKGHEDKNRLKERNGVASIPRPNKPLVWVHAVSVGEAVSALTLMQAILKKYPGIYGLLTTTTVSSAKVIQQRLPKNIIHQYGPVDTPPAINRFLNHWQPDLAIWVESELWPNLIHQTQERGIPTILFNGRMSPKSFSNWKKVKGMISPLLKRLSLCAVQSEDQAFFFKTLGATSISIMNNAKMMMTPLRIDPKKYAALRQEIGSRPLVFAASTHAGEEEIIIAAHKTLKRDYPDLLTIIAPRHIKRAPFLYNLVLKEGLAVTLRTIPSSLEGTDIYIANTLGEMGLFYALSPVVIMGGTFVPTGGHNPIEAAQFGSFILHGPHVFNNPQLYEALAALNLSQCVSDPAFLASCLRPWLDVRKDTYEEPQSLKTYREEGLRHLMIELAPYLKTLRKERG